jgi:hypothetical protein
VVPYGTENRLDHTPNLLNEGYAIDQRLYGEQRTEAIHGSNRKVVTDALQKLREIGLEHEVDAVLIDRSSSALGTRWTVTFIYQKLLMR